MEEADAVTLRRESCFVPIVGIVLFAENLNIWVFVSGVVQFLVGAMYYGKFKLQLV